MKSKKNVILSINTSDNRKSEVTLTIGGKDISKTAENNWTSQTLLPLIEVIMKENNLKFEDLTEIKLHEGPGSYTGLRVGAAVANTLSYLLQIPVNGKKDNDNIVIPHY